MRFLNEIWIGKIESPAILRPAYTEEEAKNILNGIYRKYIRIHLNTPANRWEFTFLYLINLYKFFRQNHYSVLYDSCDYVCNHSVITLAISCNYYGKQYFEFVNTWLQYGLHTGCSFVVDALKAKSHIDKTQQNGIFDETSFVMALRELKTHIEKLTASGFLQTNDVKELQSTLAIFI
ncbi:hypothetical protein PV327_007478 [Microctonus hyperodae]|uniref:Uncharacterized protein n=1 Tax=Microctonus hyperodae TaxID=165561 RepID=A0AA39KYN7_MICHY|nr:hypothetical protein PV327_007478 [Microctonus hyperodae]